MIIKTFNFNVFLKKKNSYLRLGVIKKNTIWLTRRNYYENKFFSEVNSSFGLNKVKKKKLRAGTGRVHAEEICKNWSNRMSTEFRLIVI